MTTEADDAAEDSGRPAAVAPLSTVRGDRATPTGRLLARLRESLTDPGQVLAIVLIVAFVTRAIWLTIPNGLIFDEAYYVSAARVILGIHLDAGAHYASSPVGLDPNQEHPPLGKLLIALSMSIFGDNGLGWRLPSLIAGMVALAALYLIVRAAGESRWLGVTAVGFFAFENLSLVHGRIGTLDIMVLAPILVGAWLALKGRWLAAGAVTGGGTLVKLTGVYGLAALLMWLALEAFRRWRHSGHPDLGFARPLLLVLAGYVLVFGAGLTVLDARFSSYKNPLEHLSHMVSYGANLTKPGGNPTCAANDSSPWQWLVNDCEMTYYRVGVTTKKDGQVISNIPSIDFRGAMNPVLLGALAMGVSAAVWLAWRGGSRLALWSLVWMAANYLPYVALVVARSRITYIYYFLPVIPALSVAVALLLYRTGLPRFVRWGFLAAFAVAVVAYYPFRRIP